MAQDFPLLNNSNSVSLLQVDDDITFVLENRNIDFAVSTVSAEKHMKMARRTYSKKHPIAYNPSLRLMQNQMNGDSNSPTKTIKPCLKRSSPKCTSPITSVRSSVRNDEFLHPAKRPLNSSDLSKSPVPRKIRKKEIVKMPRINGRIPTTITTSNNNNNKFHKSSQSINVPCGGDPDIQIIDIIKPGSSKAFRRDSNNSLNGREKLSDIHHRKKNSKSLPSMLKFYPSSSEDVPITEADIAPVIPSNSVIPDTSETNPGILKANKWMLSRCSQGAASIRIVEVRRAKESEMKQPPTAPERKPRGCGGRELKNLYKNLNEIVWAREKNFQQMLTSTDNRHSERITAKAVDTEKNLRRLKAGSGKQPAGTKAQQKRALIRKNPAKLALNKEKFNRLKPDMVLKKNVKCADMPINKVDRKIVRKPLVKPNKKLKMDCKVKTTTDKARSPVELKRKYQISSTGGNRVSKAKNNVKNMPKFDNNLQIVPSALRKTDKSIIETQANNFSNDIPLKKIKIYGKNTSESQACVSAIALSGRPKVGMRNLQHTSLWNSDLCADFSRHVIEQSTAQLESRKKESIKAMFEELMESWYSDTPENAKLKRKKHDEELLRSSVRQSEGAFRYKEIVVKRHEKYMQFILIPNSVKQNSLSIEALKELKDAFFVAKKDPNCRAVLLNSSGSYFCTGIDLSQLVGSNKKQNCEEMALCLKELVLTLGTFTKPVIAAVNGAAIGFGLTILTFCDVVLASDKATFFIPATKLGYVPEGAATLTLPQVVGSTVAAELLLYGRRFTADQALRHGLVSEVLWHSSLMNEVIPRMQVIVSQPLQVMEATKAMVRCQLWDKLKSHIEHEWRLLPTLWLDPKTQSSIKEALQTGWLID